MVYVVRCSRKEFFSSGLTIAVPEKWEAKTKECEKKTIGTNIRISQK